MANISQNVNIEMLEKLPNGTYKRKYPKTRADDGTTFDEHLADEAAHGIYIDRESPNVKYRLVVINEEPFLEVIEV